MGNLAAHNNYAELGETAQNIVDARIEHPDATHQEIADVEWVDTDRTYVSRVLSEYDHIVDQRRAELADADAGDATNGGPDDPLADLEENAEEPGQVTTADGTESTANVDDVLAALDANAEPDVQSFDERPVTDAGTGHAAPDPDTGAATHDGPVAVPDGGVVVKLDDDAVRDLVLGDGVPDSVSENVVEQLIAAAKRGQQAARGT